MRIPLAALVLALAPALALAQRAEGAGASVQALLRTEEPGSAFGSVATGAGDVDGDGYDDVLVSAPYYDGGIHDQGKVYLYRGGPVMSTQPAWTFAGGAESAFCGGSASAAGDVDGDGFDDFLVGLGSRSGPVGAACLFRGSPQGPAALPDWVHSGGTEDGGAVVAGAGDVDRDGFDDVLIGFPRIDAGRVLLFLGGPAGPGDAAHQEILGSPGQQLGSRLAGAGDTTGDGFDDVLIATSWAATRVYTGGSHGLTASGVLASGCFANWNVACVAAGDVNGDGLGDMATARYENGFVCYSVFLGNPTGFPTWVWSYQTDHEVGIPAGLGDFDGDGYGDLVLGFATDLGGGGARFHRGSAAGVENEPFLHLESPLPAFFGPTPFSWAYASTGAAGDVNGDGLADALLGDYVGAPDGRNEHVQIVLGPGVTRVRRFR